MSESTPPVVKTRASARNSTDQSGKSPRLRSVSSRSSFSSPGNPIKKRVGTGLKIGLVRNTNAVSTGLGTSPGSGGIASRKPGTSQAVRKSRPSIGRSPAEQMQHRSAMKGKPGNSPAMAEGEEIKGMSPAQSGSAQSTPGKGIRTRLSTGSIHMNGTTTVSAAKEKAELAMIIQQISKSETAPTQKGPGSSGKKRSGSTQGGATSETSPDHPPPKRRKIGRNDGSGEDNCNDYFCWICHKEGTLVCCELCPRVYHIRCLGLMGELPQDWVCPECEKIMRAECVDTRSKSMEMLSLDQLCILLKYALDRMMHQGSDPFKKAVDSAMVPSYSDYIFYPMDLSTLEKNIKKKQYGCTEALLADAKWILHNCIIYNGAHHSLTNSAKMIVKICKHETTEIELCPDCYLNSCIRRNDEWFSEPCRVPHTLVWAKLKGYPFWPAKALRELDGQVDVRFFGAHDRSWVPVSQCFLLSKNIPTTLQKGKKNAGLSGAISELHIHINKLRERFGSFEYAPFRTPYDMNDSYKPINPKPSSSMPFYSPKSGQNHQKKSVAAKTASAVKSKYNMMGSIKKMDNSPKKLRKDRVPYTDIKSDKVDSDYRVTADEEVLIGRDQSSIADQKELSGDGDVTTKEKTSGHNGKTDNDSRTDLVNDNDVSECKKLSENDGTRKSENDGTRKSENDGTRKSFLDSNIVDRLAKKIQALNEEETAENQTESASSSSAVTKDNIEEGQSNKDDTTSEKDQEGLEDGMTACQTKTEDKGLSEKALDSDSITKEEISEPELIKENQALKEGDSEPSNSSFSETKHVSESDIVTDRMSSAEDKIEQSTNKTEEIISFSTSEKEKAELSEKESESKEAYKKKLESTILSCKAKLGLEDGSAEKLKEVVNDKSADEEEVNEESDGTSDSEGELEDCETADTKDDNEESDSSEDLEMEVEEIESEVDEIGSDDDMEDIDKKDDSDTVSKDGKHVEPAKEPIHTDSEQIELLNKSDNTNVPTNNASTSECATADQNKPVEETAGKHQQDTTSDKLKETSKDSAQEKVSDSHVENSNISTAVLNLESEKSETTIVNKDEDIKESPPINKCPKTNDDKFGVTVNEQTVKASVQQILTKPTPEKSDTLADAKHDVLETKVSVGMTPSVKSKGTLVLCSSTGSLIESNTIEEDSESDRLVIDLDSDNYSSPKKSKSKVSVKSSSDRRRSVSSLVIDAKTIEQVGLVEQNFAGSRISDTGSRVETAKISGKSHTKQAKAVDTLSVQAPMEVDNMYCNGGRFPRRDSLEKSIDPAADTRRTIVEPSGSAASKLAGQFSKKLMSKIQKTVDEMCAEMLKDQDSNPASSDTQRLLDQARWDYSAELKELKHNFKLTIAEMRSCWETEKEQLTQALKVKHAAAMEKEIAEAKKKQWCSQCGKEAIFYCCWNTSYCDYPCQQSHWPKHLHTCLQTKDTNKTVAPMTINSTESTTSAVTTPLVMASSTGSSSATDLTSKNSTPQTSMISPHEKKPDMRQMFQDKISAAMYREEEKRGESRPGVSPKYIPMSSPINVMPNPRQGVPSTMTTSLLFPSNMASTSQMMHPPQPAMMQPMPRNLFINQQIPMQPHQMRLGNPRAVNNSNMLLPQPVLQQQAMYPVQLPQQTQQRLGGAILFQNPPQQNLMGYGMRPPF